MKRKTKKKVLRRERKGKKRIEMKEKDKRFSEWQREMKK